MKRCGQLSEKGSVEVEAVFILPLAIISVVMLIFLALFMYQRANLQTALETTLIFYKSQITDTYVSKTDTSSRTKQDGAILEKANTYSADTPLFPYRGALGDGNDLANEETFRKFFNSTAGNMLFSRNIDLSIEYHNGLLCDELIATASQELKFPLKFKLFSMDRPYTISSTARVSVVDHDNLIRNLDYTIQLLSDTKLGELAKNIGTKVEEGYNKIKEFLGAH